ncbi:sugar ABC transporter permease [Planctomonas sp. JC2975]|uniref:carbohydrate ABC transporter permease n=1 Tax=Planctomonas sp. JC2975 TaxID=2729626 RepID=UPI001472FD90|nr:sugar ABC transporter permease [Planctomonas sp. JC2975]NNC12573.1 sugar ABC transporter permease [Planctomonas sp. JC2975]
MTTQTTGVPLRAKPRNTPIAAVKRGSVRKSWPQYLSITPFYVLFLVFGAFPIVFSIVISFTQWDGMGKITFVGFDQYRFLFSDSLFWQSVLNTFIIWIISTVPMLFLALVIAFLLHQNIRMKSFYRVAFFIPNVTSMVAMAVVFGSMFSDQFGLVNSFLQWFGGTSAGVQWLSDPWGIKVTVAIMVIWRWTGYNAIIYLAGLQSISTELYDSARVDGAGTWRIFSRITVPMLRPVILFTVIASTIGGLSLFTEPQVLLANSGVPNLGGTNSAGLTIVLYQYYEAFNKFDFGYASAIAWALFVLVLLFAVINWRLVNGRKENAFGEAVPGLFARMAQRSKSKKEV